MTRNCKTGIVALGAAGLLLTSTPATAVGETHTHSTADTQRSTVAPDDGYGAFTLKRLGYKYHLRRKPRATGKAVTVKGRYHYSRCLSRHCGAVSGQTYKCKAGDPHSNTWYHVRFHGHKYWAPAACVQYAYIK